MACVRTAASVLLMAALAGCGGSSDGDDDLLETHDSIAAPAWQPGFRWNYTIAQELGGEVVKQVPASLRVLRSHTHGAEAGSLVAALPQAPEIAPDMFMGQMFAPSAGPLSFVRGADLAIADFGNGRDFTCTPWPCRDTLRTDSIFGDEKAGRVFVFPLARDAQWDLLDGDGEAGLLRAHVLGQHEVSVPAGVFQSIRVRVTLDPDWAAEVEDQLGTELEFAVDIDYAPEVRNVVRFEQRYAGAVPGGEASMGYVAELDSYSLRSADALSDDEIVRLLGGDPGGVVTPTPSPVTAPPPPPPLPEPVTVTFAQEPAGVVDAATTPTVTWTVAADGAGGPYTHEWSVVTPGGLDWADGATYTRTVDTLGAYLFTIITRDGDGGLVDWTEFGVLVRWTGSATKPCTLNLPPVEEGACEAFEFTAGSGFGTVNVTATLADDPAIDQGTLVVYDSFGPSGSEVARVAMAERSASASVTEGFSGTWRAVVEPPTGPETEATYTVLIEPAKPAIWPGGLPQP